MIKCMNLQLYLNLNIIIYRVSTLNAPSSTQNKIRLWNFLNSFFCTWEIGWFEVQHPSNHRFKHISLFCSSSRCIHAAMIRSAAWEATATALITPRPAASTAAGGRSAAIGMPCAVPGTAAAIVRPWHSNAITPQKPSCKPHCSRVRFGNWMSRLMQISWRKWLVPSSQTVLLNVA